MLTNKDNAHVKVMKNANATELMERRGFTYRHNGSEGIVFVSMSNETAKFDAALGAMTSNDDGVLRYIDSQDGAIYFVPADAGYFLNVDPPPQGRGAMKQLLGREVTGLLYDRQIDSQETLSEYGRLPGQSFANRLFDHGSRFQTVY